MALQLWLPLNGNICNQGLCDVKISGHPNSWENGKIGKCGLFNNNNYLFMNNYSQDLFQPSHDKSISIACWVKCTGTVDTTNSYIIAWNSYEFSYRYNRIMFRLGNGRENTYGVYGTIDGNGWHHVAGIWDAKNKKVQIYFDGELFKDITVSQSINFNSISSSITLPYRDIKHNLSINDFRLYDECLSPKQIKYISQAMICHYPMGNIDGKIGGRNLLLNSGFRETIEDNAFTVNGMTYNTYAKGWGGYNGGIDNPTTNYHAYLDMSTRHYIFDETNGSNNWKGVVPYTTIKKKAKSYVFSATVKATGNGTRLFGGIYYKGNSDHRGFHAGLFYIEPIPSGKEIRVYAEVPLKDDIEISDLENIYLYGYSFRSNSKLEMWNPKLEEGSIPTPYTPAPEDNSQFYDNIISDISGYRNNATVKDSTCPTWSDDSPRYLGSYKFDATKEMFLNPIVFSGFSDSYTFSWWGKESQSDYSSMYWGFMDGNRLNLFNYNGYLFWNTGDGSSNPFNDPVTTNKVSSYIDGKWHHYCVTGDGTSNKLYIDGKIYGIAETYRKITGTKIHINGFDDKDNYKINGNISDFRIYATALSESDVLNLYQSSASLDSQGNLMLAGEVIE